MQASRRGWRTEPSTPSLATSTEGYRTGRVMTANGYPQLEEGGLDGGHSFEAPTGRASTAGGPNGNGAASPSFPLASPSRRGVGTSGSVAFDLTGDR